MLSPVPPCTPLWTPLDQDWLYLQRTPYPAWKADIISETWMLWELKRNRSCHLKRSRPASQKRQGLSWVWKGELDSTRWREEGRQRHGAERQDSTYIQFPSWSLYQFPWSLWASQGRPQPVHQSPLNPEYRRIWESPQKRQRKRKYLDVRETPHLCESPCPKVWVTSFLLLIPAPEGVRQPPFASLRNRPIRVEWHRWVDVGMKDLVVDTKLKKSS